ncbi:hypothetical protein, partial [Blastococcus sp. CT_GayMR20]|uniref:hypothetical protein n=1 Tax=Blastococcus sp. CT_GayMR20 TaxID=2559609 RepID=UPI00142F6C89
RGSSGAASLGVARVVTASAFASVVPQGAREDFLVVKGYREQFDAATAGAISVVPTAADLRSPAATFAF